MVKERGRKYCTMAKYVGVSTRSRPRIGTVHGRRADARRPPRRVPVGAAHLPSSRSRQGLPHSALRLEPVPHRRRRPPDRHQGAHSTQDRRGLWRHQDDAAPGCDPAHQGVRQGGRSFVRDVPLLRG
eukprot:2261918-Prymnesium_polylepis.1